MMEGNVCQQCIDQMDSDIGKIDQLIDIFRESDYVLTSQWIERKQQLVDLKEKAVEIMKKPKDKLDEADKVASFIDNFLIPAFKGPKK